MIKRIFRRVNYLRLKSLLFRQENLLQEGCHLLKLLTYTAQEHIHAFIYIRISMIILAFITVHAAYIAATFSIHVDF